MAIKGHIEAIYLTEYNYKEKNVSLKNNFTNKTVLPFSRNIRFKQSLLRPPPPPPLTPQNWKDALQINMQKCSSLFFLRHLLYARKKCS